MKDRPILFSGPMVRAILEDRKTQTRRLDGLHEVNADPDAWTWTGERFERKDGTSVIWPAERYIVGEHRWVREAWQAWTEYNHLSPRYIPKHPLNYPASTNNLWDSIRRNARFMPRWASRLTLEITDIRVQRLQEISEADAKSEGIEFVESSAAPWAPFLYCDYNLSDPRDTAEWWASPIESFRTLWDSINTKRGHCWGTNPWVWAITFKRKSA